MQERLDELISKYTSGLSVVKMSRDGPRMKIRSRWLRAMGLPITVSTPVGKLFRRFPHRCLLCGRVEDPLRNEQFIALFGTIIKRPWAKMGIVVWYCHQLNITQPTGNLEPHFRFICNQHGGPITDNLTNVVHDLPSKSHPWIIWASNWIHEIQYWARVVARFVKG